MSENLTEKITKSKTITETKSTNQLSKIATEIPEPKKAKPTSKPFKTL